jgi:hypothetical protein
LTLSIELRPLLTSQIFELLLKFGLPSFSTENWKSTIRKEVRAHPKYQDMEPWQGRETADITYHDSTGVFTSILVQNGYLESDVWRSARPIYYLEVKTTTRDCSEQFYMSGSQYLRVSNVGEIPCVAANKLAIDAEHEVHVGNVSCARLCDSAGL